MIRSTKRRIHRREQTVRTVPLRIPSGSVVLLDSQLFDSLITYANTRGCPTDHDGRTKLEHLLESPFVQITDTPAAWCNALSLETGEGRFQLTYNQEVTEKPIPIKQGGGIKTTRVAKVISFQKKREGK